MWKLVIRWQKTRADLTKLQVTAPSKIATCMWLCTNVASQCSGFRPCVITYFNTIVFTVCDCSEELGWDRMAGQLPSAIILKLHKSMSSKSGSVKTTSLFGAVHNDNIIKPMKVFICPLITFCWKYAFRVLYSCMAGALETRRHCGLKMDSDIQAS